jgi:hypothetical protein
MLSCACIRASATISQLIADQNPMPYFDTLCINMPQTFPTAQFTQFLDKGRQVLIGPNGPSPGWKEFALASNIIGWRYRAAYEALEHLRGRYTTTSGPVDHEDLYQRECALFTLFTAGVSCIEASVYGIAAQTSTAVGFPFGVKEQRACSPTRLRDWLKPHSAASALATVIQELANSSEWSLWIEVRNRLSHRGNLPGIICAAIGGPLPATNPIVFAETTSTAAIDMGVSELNAHFDWITATLAKLMVEAKAL